MKIRDVIVTDKEILGGTPVFKGTRVPIANLFDYLKAGDSINDFLNDFDYIPKDYCIAVLNAAESFVTGTYPEEMNIQKAKPSDFRGKLKLTDEQYEDFQIHLKNIRNEWDNDR